MIGRVEGLKRKVSRSHRCTIFIQNMVLMRRQLSELSANATIPTHSALRSRLEYLDSLESMANKDDPAFDRWADVRLDRWLVDWALRTGNDKTAQTIARSRGIEVSGIAKFLND